MPGCRKSELPRGCLDHEYIRQIDRTDGSDNTETKRRNLVSDFSAD